MFRVSSSFNEKYWREQLFAAAEQDDAPAVASALELHPEALQWKDADGLTVLMQAARAGAKQVAAVLVAAGAEVDETNNKGSTALMFAAAAGKAGFIDILLKAGADVNHANGNGHTALILAASDGYKNSLTLLLESGADPFARDADGKTARDYAVEYGHAEAAGKLAAEEEKRQAQAPAVIVEPAETPLELPKFTEDANSRHLKTLEQRMIRSGLTAWRTPSGR